MEPLPEGLKIFFELLSQFTGTGGGEHHSIVHFGLSAIFWTILLVVAHSKLREQSEPREALLMWGFGISLARELLMILVKVFQAYSLIDTVALHQFFPPLEHALTSIGRVVVAAAFILYLVKDRRLTNRYLWSSVTATVLCYFATFWWWADFIQANPESKFGQTWCDWLFRINGSAWMAVAIFYLWSRTTGWVRNTVTVALSLFFLDDFLKLPDMALKEQYEPIFATVRHSLSLAAILPLGYIYIRDQALEVKNAVHLLESRVQDRTAELEEAMAHLSQANTQLEALSTEDPLTGLKNRRYFDNALRKEYRRALRHQDHLSLLVVDADHFKAINDRYGHPFGDIVLKRLAGVISDTIGRSGDVSARFGGEEFVVLLPDTDRLHSLQIAEKIRSRIAALTLEAKGETVTVTASIGVACVVPRTPDDGSELLAAADRALYLAKENGRNRVQAVDDAPSSSHPSQ